MAVSLSPIGGVAGQFFDNNGVPLSGGKIYTYASGTTTNQATYTSAAGVTVHTNPIILDSAGRVPSGEIWLTDGVQYKFVIKTSVDVTIGTYDNIVGINSNFLNYDVQEEIQTATAGQTVFTLNTVTYTPGTNTLQVFVDGVNQYDGVSYAYVETDNTTVTFTSGLHVGALVKFTTAVTLSGSVTTADLVTYDPPFAGSVETTVENKLAQIISVIDFGAVADFSTDQSTIVQTALDSFDANGGDLWIPKGVKWDYASITQPDEVNILDYSGWDYDNDDWTGQIKVFLKTVDPGTKNANEYKVIAPYHPGVVVDNIGDGLTEKRASVVFRYQGSTIWQIGQGSNSSNLNYHIAAYGSYAGAPTAGTNVFEIDRDTGTMGWNTRFAGVDYTWYSVRNATASFRSYASAANDIELQAGNITNGLLYRQQISGTDGSWNYVIGGTAKFQFGADSSFTAWNRKIVPKNNNYTLASNDSASVFTNTGATGGFTYTLPVASVGAQYEFYVTVAQNNRLQPNAGDAFRGYTAATSFSTKVAGKYMESSTIGSVCKLKCVVAGYWEFERLGTWTDQP